jgi:hypothetical protein
MFGLYNWDSSMKGRLWKDRMRYVSLLEQSSLELRSCCETIYGLGLY